ncbi:unnamed protein product [Lota lota]
MDYDPFEDTLVPELRPIQIVTLVFYGLVFILGVPGNALVVWVTGFGMSRTVTSIWFLNLSLADFLCCLFLPILMVPLAHDDHWHFGPIACTLLKSLFYLVMHCSVLLLVLISLDRCMLGELGRLVPEQQAPSAGGLGLCGSLAPGTVGYHSRAALHQGGGFGNKEGVLWKAFSGRIQIIVCFRFVSGFLLPFMAIVFSHIAVYKRASAMSGNIRSKRTLKVIIAVSTSFFFCWLPLHITDILIT